MARSRVCLTCGHDTAGVAPEVEPVYGWTVVRCARCGRVSPTRRRAGFVDWWRTARRRFDATRVLVFQLCSAGGILAVLPMACLGLNRSLAGYRADPYSILVVNGGRGLAESLEEWRLAGEGPMAGMVAGIATFAGIWIGATLRHRGVWRSWGQMGLMLVVMSQVVGWLRVGLGGSPSPVGAPAWAEPMGAGVLMVMALSVTVVGIPIGAGVKRVQDEVRQAWYKVLVRRARRRRQR